MMKVGTFMATPRYSPSPSPENLQHQSRPFDRPETGKIAVKVINHYGDQVLKVFRVM
jgi:hypothetical protein